MAECVRRFSGLTARQIAIFDYALNKTSSSSTYLDVITLLFIICSVPYTIVFTHPFPDMRGSEILIDMHVWVLTHFELLSLDEEKWVVNVVVSMMAYMLSAIGDHPYFFVTTFMIKFHAGILLNLAIFDICVIIITVPDHVTGRGM